MNNQQKPTTKPVRTAKRGKVTYHLHKNGELWTSGSYAVLCGYVSDPDNIEEAIDSHEEEMHYLLAAARREFGL